jgi:hypothetical protein
VLPVIDEVLAVPVSQDYYRLRPLQTRSGPGPNDQSLIRTRPQPQPRACWRG